MRCLVGGRRRDFELCVVSCAAARNCAGARQILLLERLLERRDDLRLVRHLVDGLRPVLLHPGELRGDGGHGEERGGVGLKDSPATMAARDASGAHVGDRATVTRGSSALLLGAAAIDTLAAIYTPR